MFPVREPVSGIWKSCCEVECWLSRLLGVKGFDLHLATGVGGTGSINPGAREHTDHICAPGGHRDAYFSLNKCITGEKPKATSHIQGTGLAFERLWSL